ncbi:MAG: DNA gyrase subunit A [Gammaproteobacteria bacterium]|nr:DNA gyrase subunit A [Gammaproteobacteria bacterium]MYK46472.1 DNA gyrase subunit A [Gammaproteobacteria bacterium]
MSDIDSGPDSPPPAQGGILSRSIEDELRQSYLAYAMSVIVSRALPDVRDGLKPVHRRVLYAMSELGITYNRPHRKSAYVVGEVMGKYHPHGDSAIYETIVRLAQDWMMRYPLADGHGNFGSMDRDPPAAQRYTEVRMARITGDMLVDLDKETVDVVLNYDETLTIPEVLPTRVPNLLVNGSSGIAVGMATNIPPHNMTEVINGCLALLDDPGASVDDLMEHIHGPDFPTGAIINGRAGIVRAYRFGRGRIYVRARAHVEDAGSGRETIVVTEIPYQVNKAGLVEKIAELVKEKRIEGISELRDESDKDGVRIVIELRRGESGDVVLNNLYALTQLQSVFGINCVALVDGQPRTVNLREMLEHFLRHRREVVVRRTTFLLRRARRQGHLLEGQAVALENIDEVVELIRASASSAEARQGLMGTPWKAESVKGLLARTDVDACRPEGLGEEFGVDENGLYHLSDDQAQAILQMTLNRLTALEKDKLVADYEEILGEIQELLDILGSVERQRQIIREELEDIRERYGDERRTEILSSHLDLTDEDLIAQEDVVVTVSHRGYAKTQPLSVYQAQRRGGTGRAATGLRDEDFVEHLLIANSHDTLLCFSNAGKVYWLRVFYIPQGSRNAQGRPLVNMLPLDDGERITAILPLPRETEVADDELEPEEGDEADDVTDLPDEGDFVFMATANGTVKKTPLERFSRPRTAGLIALRLEPGNTLVSAAIIDASSDVLLVSSSGKAARFEASAVRAVGRTARGVRGIRLTGDHRLIALIVPKPDGFLLTASERGYGKRTSIGEFPVKGRGVQGVIAMRTGDRNGDLIGAVQVFDDDEIMLISDQGTLVRTHAADVSQTGRNTQGVRLIRLADDAKLVGVERIVESVNGDTGEADDEATADDDELDA